MELGKELKTLFLLLNYKPQSDGGMPGWGNETSVVYTPESNDNYKKYAFYPHPYGGSPEGCVEFNTEQEIIDFLINKEDM